MLEISEGNMRVVLQKCPLAFWPALDWLLARDAVFLNRAVTRARLRSPVFVKQTKQEYLK
ncbi:hypothetical protein [Aminobacter ciceronei]|uniref:Uncharacterized protein n=1 Tax=Aminobacter ciceronei TaxID=150723 RepID=A0ABR6C8K1_9HYPH|nr:hypothetical protein [Aminobacter ciceronei]MBA8907561.1 hypothetical protein [Aminobacter ciceronei]MBA9021338.1 hypothetical protein [Aminobacter ciceronei]